MTYFKNSFFFISKLTVFGVFLLKNKTYFKKSIVFILEIKKHIWIFRNVKYFIPSPYFDLWPKNFHSLEYWMMPSMIKFCLVKGRNREIWARLWEISIYWGGNSVWFALYLCVSFQELVTEKKKKKLLMPLCKC